jgi:hypothetical protein
MIRVGEINKCLRCDNNRQISTGPVVQTSDPGSDELNRMLKMHKIPSNTEEPVIKIAERPSSMHTVQDALKIMKSQPIPDDVKQFKQIKKIVSLMEKLISKE